MKLICFLKRIFYSIVHLQIIDGHDYVEIYNNKDVSILKCSRCNHISVGFYESR